VTTLLVTPRLSDLVKIPGISPTIPPIGSGDSSPSVLQLSDPSTCQYSRYSNTGSENPRSATRSSSVIVLTTTSSHLRFGSLLGGGFSITEGYEAPSVCRWEPHGLHKSRTRNLYSTTEVHDCQQPAPKPDANTTKYMRRKFLTKAIDRLDRVYGSQPCTVSCTVHPPTTCE